jgi:acetylglutamate kinase
LVLKVGGSELDRPGFVEDLVEVLRGLCAENQVVLVHGGGKAIARLQEQLRLEPRFVEGLRVTDDASLDVAEMVLSGLVNKRLVARLVSAGIAACGLSGVDDGMLRVVKMKHHEHDLGWVGDIKNTNQTLPENLLDAQIVPVISPISLGLDGHTYNVNADHAAAALSCALRADELVTINGGMVPKVRSALSALDRGVPTVRITDLTGLASEGGTCFFSE